MKQLSTSEIVTTLRMPVQTIQSEKYAKGDRKITEIPVVSSGSLDRKAEEMKIFLSINPIPREFLKKK